MNYRKILGDTTALFFSALLIGILGYIFRIILARTLTPTEFGLFYAVFALISFFLFFRGLGLTQALIKYIAEFSGTHDHKKINSTLIIIGVSQLIMSLLLGGIIYLLAQPLAEHYFKEALAVTLLQYFALYIVLSAIFIYLKATLQGYQLIKLTSSAELLRMLAVVILTLLFFEFLSGPLTPLLAYLIGWALGILYLLYSFITRLPKNKTLAPLKPLSKTLYLFGLPVILTEIGGKVIAQLDTLLLTYYTTLEQVGIYNVILPSSLLFLIIATSIAGVLFPLVSKLWAEKKKKEITQLLHVVYKYLLIIALPLLFAVFTYASLFITLLFGESYNTGALAYQILLIGVLFYLIATINTYMLSAIGKPSIVTAIIGIGATLNFVANVLLIPQYGLEGAALSTTATYLLVLILSTYYTAKHFSIILPLKQWMLTTLAGLAFLGTLYTISTSLSINATLELTISLSISTTIYLFLLYALRIVQLQELRHYYRLLRP